KAFISPPRVSIPQSGKFYFKPGSSLDAAPRELLFQSLNRENSISSGYGCVGVSLSGAVSIPQSGKFYFKQESRASACPGPVVSIPQSGKFYFKPRCPEKASCQVVRFQSLNRENSISSTGLLIEAHTLQQFQS